MGLLIAVASLLACGGVGTPGKPAALPSGVLPPGALHLQRVELMDPRGFAQPMVAATALVPVGWSTHGGVVWSTAPCTEPARFDWLARSPDGRSRVGLFPTEIWAAGTSGSMECMPAQHRSVGEYLTARVQRYQPDAQIVGIRPRADFLDATRAWVDGLQGQLQQLGVQMWADGAEVHYVWDEAGVRMEGVLAASAIFYGSELSNPMGGPPLWTLTGGTTGTWFASAPRGTLDLKLSEAIRRSIAPDPAWANEMFAFQERMGAIQTQGVRERAAIIVAGGAAMTKATLEANQRATDAYAARDAASDRSHQATIDRIRGVERYADPAGHTVQLDNTWNHAWSLDNGTYLLVDDPNFDPAVTLGVNGQELQRAQ